MFLACLPFYITVSITRIVSVCVIENEQMHTLDTVALGQSRIYTLYICKVSISYPQYMLHIERLKECEKHYVNDDEC